MTIKLKPSTEESTYIVTVSFFDVGRVPVAPKMAQWTLKDEDGAIINGRDAVNIDVPETTETIVLTGVDLELPDITKPMRYLLVEAVYDSILYGNDLNLREEARFPVADLFAKPYGPVIDPVDYGLSLGQLEAHLATLYAPIAKGVTQGDLHDHSGGDGAQIAYATLSGLPALGTAATTDSTDYATASHTHSGVYEPANANLQSHIISTANPHSVTAAQAGADASGTAAGLIVLHEAAANPHPGYLTPTEGDAAYSAVSHAHSGVYDPAGTASSAVSAHAGGTSVHAIASVTGLQTALDGKSATSHDHAATYAPLAKGVTNGDSHDHNGGDGAQIAYSGLSGLPTLGTAAATASTDYATAAHTHGQLHDAVTVSDSSSIDLMLAGQQISAAAIFGTTTGTVCQGNDSRVALAVQSNTTGITGADQITNIVSLTQAEYDAITPSATTFYVITG